MDLQGEHGEDEWQRRVDLGDLEFDDSIPQDEAVSNGIPADRQGEEDRKRPRCGEFCPRRPGRYRLGEHLDHVGDTVGVQKNRKP
jgi:hypothetical protein